MRLVGAWRCDAGWIARCSSRDDREAPREDRCFTDSGMGGQEDEHSGTHTTRRRG